MTHAKRAAADKRALDRAASIRAEYPTPVELDVTERVALWGELQSDLTDVSVIVRKHDPSGTLENACDRIGDFVDDLLAALAPTAGSGQERDRIKEAREWLRSRSRWDEHENRLHYVLSALDAALAAPQGTGSNREAELEAALQPFARAAERVHESAPDGRLVDEYTVGAPLTVGDLRRARALLATKEIEA